MNFTPPPLKSRISFHKKTLVAATVAALLATPVFASVFNVEAKGNNPASNGALNSATIRGTYAQAEPAPDASSVTWIHSYVEGKNVTGENLDLSYTLIRDKTDEANQPFSVSGATLMLNNSATATLSGTTTKISLDIQDGKYFDDSSSATEAVRVENGSTLTLVADQTKITASTGQEGPSIVGIGISHQAKVDMTGKSVDIDVTGATDFMNGEYYRYSIIGISMKDGSPTLTSSSDTELNITATGTATGEGAASVVGIDTENSTVTLNGTTVIKATAHSTVVSDETVGLDIGNETDSDVNSLVTVNDLTINASGGCGPVNAINLGDENEWVNGSLKNSIVFTSNGKLDVTASVKTADDEFTATGIRYELYSSAPITVNLNGTTTITAPEAIASFGYPLLDNETAHANAGLTADQMILNVAGDLTANGNVSGFLGTVNQTKGTTTLKTTDKKFFGGIVNLTGGKTLAEDASWEGTSDKTKLTVDGGDLTIGSMTVKRSDALALTSGTLTTGTFNIDSGVVVSGGNTFAMNIKGGSEASSIGGEVTVGSLTIENARVNILQNAEFDAGQTLTLGEGAVLSNEGYITATNAYFQKGSQFIDKASSATQDNVFGITDATVYLQGGQIFGKDGQTAADTVLIQKDSEYNDRTPVLNVESNYSFTQGAELNGGTLNVQNDAVLTLGTLALKAADSLVTIGGSDKAGSIDVNTLTIAEGGKVTVTGTGTLQTFSDQIFTTGLGADGQATDAGALKYDNTKLEVQTGGTLAFKDAQYNQIYVSNAKKLVSEGTALVFNGQLIDTVSGDLSIDDVEENVVQSNVDVTISAGSGNSATVDKTFGSSSLKVGENVSTVTVSAGKTITLVGDTEGSKEVISFATQSENNSVSVSGEVALGHEGSTNNAGKLSTAVALTDSGKLTVNTGKFEVAKVTTGTGTSVDVKGGEVSFGTITANGGKLTVADAATKVTVNTLDLTASSTLELSQKATAVETLKVTDNTTHNVTGALAVDKIELATDANAVINIGTTGDAGKRGDLVLGNDVTSLKGLTFFLDPAYVDGKQVTDGSRLVYTGNTIDGNIAVGENSYAVLGGNSDTELVAVFNNGTLSWGTKTGDVLAALYVAKPINVTTGSLTVDGTLTRAPTTPAAGSVSFAANSALVADVTGLTDSDTLITATSVSVTTGSKAVLVGTIKQGVNYQLTSDTDQNKNWKDNIFAGNAMWKLTMDDTTGKISATLQDASMVYGNAMQGSALANAGMLSADADTQKYVNDLLTDASGNISALPSVAARFDAAMNAAGALATFTTAKDRATDLREAVRSEANKGEGSGLWVQVAGGQTKLKGISTGGQSLHTKTNAYGLVIGGEGRMDTFKFGAAFAAGTGDTKNNSVSAKDDFDYYGLSVYGKYAAGPVELLADASATWLKSDLTVGNGASIDTDTTTAVYSLGVQVRKTFELSAVDVTPFIGADLYHVRGDGYSAGHGIEVDDSDATLVEFPIGAELSKSFETQSGMTVAPSFTFAVVPTVGGKDIDSKVTFAGANSTYNFTYADDVKLRGHLGLTAQKANFNFGLQAGYEWGNEERSSYNVQARMKYHF